MAEYVRTKTAVSVPYKDGRSVAHRAGEHLRLDDLSDHVQQGLKNGDPWLDNLFESGGKPEEKDVDPMGVDGGKLAMEGVESLSRERATLAPEHRFGADATAKHDFDKGRTLPTSGADLAADEKFAAGGSDTSENVPEEHAKHLDYENHGEVPTSDAPRANDSADDAPTKRGRPKK